MGAFRRPGFGDEWWDNADGEVGAGSRTVPRKLPPTVLYHGKLGHLAVPTEAGVLLHWIPKIPAVVVIN